MRLLLDTHVLLWMLNDNAKLSLAAYGAVFDPRNTLFLSIASLWEITIKAGKGRLQVDATLPELFARLEGNAEIRLLPIQKTHLLKLAALYRHRHGDPFDRLIAAQALSEGCILVSADAKLDDYGVTRLW